MPLTHCVHLPAHVQARNGDALEGKAEGHDAAAEEDSLRHILSDNLKKRLDTHLMAYGVPIPSAKDRMK